MRRFTIIICAVASTLVFASTASAQAIPQGGSIFNPPLPAPPPPPKIAPPVIPQMDAPASPNYAPAPSPSFSDRISTCLDAAAAAGLGPGARTTYSRNCANR
jgi:hypothetical protein